MICFTLLGQMKSGKNNIIVLRNGKHIPKKEWAEWRDRMLSQLKSVSDTICFENPCKVTINYFAGDKRRRDVPGMMDALWHCLERSGLVLDDSLLENVTWLKFYDKKNPRAEIRIEEI